MQPVDATGVSPTRAALGASWRASCGAAAAVVGVAGGGRPTNAYRGGGGRRPGGPLRGHRRLQADRSTGATGAGYGGGHSVAPERSGGRGARPLAAIVRTRNRVGGGLAAAGVGAALRLQPGGVGAAVRSQREMGIAAAGVGGAFAGGHPATGARGPDRGAAGDEISRAGGAAKPGGLPAHGGHFRCASLPHARSWRTVCRLAAGIGCHPPTHSGRSRAVFQNAEAGEASSRAGGRTDP